MWLPLVISTNMPTTLPYVFIFLFSYFSVGQKIDNIQKIFSIEALDPPTANIGMPLSVNKIDMRLTPTAAKE